MVGENLANASFAVHALSSPNCPRRSKRLSRTQQAALALLCLVPLGMALLWAHRFNHRDGVARAEARAKRAKQDLSLVFGARNRAEAIIQKAHLGKSPAAQAILSTGDELVGNATKRNQLAQMQLRSAEMGERLNAVCTNSVAQYDDFNLAQEGFALLTLAGLEDVYLRVDTSKLKTGTAYALCTRSDLTPKALAALQTTQVRKVLTSGDSFAATEALRTLQLEGLQVTIRHLKLPNQGEAPTRLLAVFVRQADEDHARELLAASSFP